MLRGCVLIFWPQRGATTTTTADVRCSCRCGGTIFTVAVAVAVRVGGACGTVAVCSAQGVFNRWGYDDHFSHIEPRLQQRMIVVNDADGAAEEAVAGARVEGQQRRRKKSVESLFVGSHRFLF